MRHRAESGRVATNESLPVITASEIGEYAYCSRAWWYRHVVKLPLPEGEGRGRLAAGTLSHSRHGAWVDQSSRLRTMGLLLALVGIGALVVALLLGVLK
jgi:CRISPR/Cas system-associated exonuclease Cas4 (RecB family)